MGTVTIRIYIPTDFWGGQSSSFPCPRLRPNFEKAEDPLDNYLSSSLMYLLKANKWQMVNFYTTRNFSRSSDVFLL